MTYVDAPTKREAIKIGVKKMRSTEYTPGYKNYYGWYWDESTNPYTGVKAEKAECDHGVCFCEGLGCENELENCPACHKEMQDQCEHEFYNETKCIYCDKVKDGHSEVY